MERAENVRSMLDLKPIELFAVLRKNPGIFLLDSAETRARYNAIHKVGVLHGKRAYDVRPSARAGKGDAISAFPDLALRVCSGCKNCQWMQVGWSAIEHLSTDTVHWKLTGPEHSQIALILTARTE
eukprot:1136952-Pelagomonas_calceolata.AAC.2